MSTVVTLDEALEALRGRSKTLEASACVEAFVSAPVLPEPDGIELLMLRHVHLALRKTMPQGELARAIMVTLKPGAIRAMVQLATKTKFSKAFTENDAYDLYVDCRLVLHQWVVDWNTRQIELVVA